MTIQHAKKLLGKTSNKFSDSEIDFLISQFYGIAEIVTSIVGSKQTTRVIESNLKKEDYGSS